MELPIKAATTRPFNAMSQPPDGGPVAFQVPSVAIAVSRSVPGLPLRMER